MNPRQANLSERRAHARSFARFYSTRGTALAAFGRREMNCRVASFARPTAPHRRAGWGRCSPLTFRGTITSWQETWSGSASRKLCGGRVISASCWDKGATSTTSGCPGNATGHVRPRPHQARGVAKPKAAPRACFACSPAPTRWRRGSAASLAAEKLFCARGASKAQTLPVILDNREKIPHNGGGCAATAFPLEDG